MSYNLFLDDFRTPQMAFNLTHDKRFNLLDWVLVENYDQFIKSVKKYGVPDLVAFDHDLGFEHYDLSSYTDCLTWEEYYISSDREYTGYDCAKWLCDYCFDNNIKFPDYIVHSQNTVGATNIKKYIQNFLKYNPELS